MYAPTGLQVQPFNTAFQLVAAARARADRRPPGRLLLIPDLLGYWLTGEQVAEVTNASTTGLLDGASRNWAKGLAVRLGIDPSLLPPLCEPGTVIGPLREDVRAQTRSRLPRCR